MADAGSGEEGALGPLTPYLGGLAALVVGLAVVFWGVGQLRGDGGDTDEPVAATTATETPAPTTPSPTGPEPTEPEPEATATGVPTSPASPTGPATPTAPATTVAPAEVSVQVLDATGGAGGADEVAAELRDGGYDVVAENAAVTTYEETTVFYTEGSADAARQIAAEFGYPVVEAKPDNLSSSVDVHVVAGEDRG